MTITKRPVNEAMENLLFEKIPLLDHGYIIPVDYMGTQECIVDAARVSYGEGTKQITNTKNLLRYLYSHQHCYHPDMEVLTKRGWVKWNKLNQYETFLVPDPVTKNVKEEVLEVKMRGHVGDLHCFKNSRMSYAVTDEHRMHFKSKGSDNYEIVKAKDIKNWGHFEPLINYTVNSAGVSDKKGEFVGFSLGDGCWASPNRIAFHLKKSRKIQYLERLLAELKILYKKERSNSKKGAYIYWVEKPQFLDDWTEGGVAKNKRLIKKLDCLTVAEKVGIWNGLVNSDGSIKADRPQVEFSSKSKWLTKIFIDTSPYLNMDAHRVRSPKGVYSATAYRSGRTSLEARKQYFSKKPYVGDVYCTTSSTGLLIVRGSNRDYGFICGNCSPFEMAEIKLEIKLPVFVMRQWIRHRTASVNEYSGRYSIMLQEFYIPKPEHMAAQSLSNKQGRETEPMDIQEAIEYTKRMEKECKQAYDTYEMFIADSKLEVDGAGYDCSVASTPMARELARIVLPVNIYTKAVWKCDIRNLLHLIALRMDPHAQYEIRVYADAIYSIIKNWMPDVVKAFEDYTLEAYKLSRMEVAALQSVLTKENTDKAVLELEKQGATKREVAQFQNKFAGEIR